MPEHRGDLPAGTIGVWTTSVRVNKGGNDLPSVTCPGRAGLIWCWRAIRARFLYDTSDRGLQKNCHVRPSGTPNSVCIPLTAATIWLGTETGCSRWNWETRHFVPFAADGIPVIWSNAGRRRRRNALHREQQRSSAFHDAEMTQEVCYHLTVRDGLTGNQRRSLWRPRRRLISAVSTVIRLCLRLCSATDSFRRSGVTGLFRSTTVVVEIGRGGKDFRHSNARCTCANKELR